MKKRTRKSRLTKTDVNAICELKDELIKYKYAFRFLFYLIVNRDKNKAFPHYLISDLPDDDIARAVCEDIRKLLNPHPQ